MLNSEVEDYLKQNDLIYVPVGTVEMHGGYPLDVEEVISEAFALKMAEKTDGLILTGLQYFYAGATASGRGTVQVSVREGIDYLGAIAKSLLRQGFKRQVYLSFHGPATMTCSAMVRDFFDETGVPILYIDLSTQMFTNAAGVVQDIRDFHAISVGAYKIMDRLQDVPLVTGYESKEPQSCAWFNDILSLAQQSGSIGYCFAKQTDHMPTIDLPDEKTREDLADRGVKLIEKMTEKLKPEHIADQLVKIREYDDEVCKEKPWIRRI